jgi:gamma-glutamylcyclotransferase (GGCT)/AIG2-like uncharacterized protein YtfP
MRYPFFVYGTLKRGEPNYARLLDGRTASEVPATLAAAALYDFGPYPFLVREDDLLRPGDVVQGELVELPDGLYAAALAELDGLEGYVEGGLSNLYEREVCTVSTADGPRLAYVYVAGAQMLAQIRAGALRRIGDGVWRGKL